MYNIGKIIREERLNKNMKQEELAQLIGVQGKGKALQKLIWGYAQSTRT